jgi:hypothetical protein
MPRMAARKGGYLNFRFRLGLVLLTGATTGLLYAEGVVKSGWIEAALFLPLCLFLMATGSLARVLSNLLIGITAISVSLAIFDLILRPTFEDRLHYSPMNITSHVLPELPMVGRWDSHQTFDMEGYGDLAAMAADPSLQERRQIVFRTDEFGFRNRPGARPTDVVVVGDSFPAGAGTTDEEIFPRLLEDTYGFRTYNLSFPGGPYQQLINFKIEWPKWNATPPHMIWTIYTGNDMEDEGGTTWDLEHLPWQHGFPAWREKFKSYRRRSPIHQWMDAVRLKFNDKPAHVIVRSLPDGMPILFFQNQEMWANRSRQEVEQHPNFPKLQRTLTAMRELTEERHVELQLLILPTKGEVYRWLLEERPPRPEDSHASGFALAVLEACRIVGIDCYDMKPYLVSEAKRLYSEGKLLWWRDDTHIGRYGHSAIAAYVANNLLRASSRSGAYHSRNSLGHAPASVCSTC